MALEEWKQALRQAAQFQTESQQSLDRLTAERERAKEKVSKSRDAVVHATAAQKQLAAQVKSSAALLDAAKTKSEALHDLIKAESLPGLELRLAEAQKNGQVSLIVNLRKEVDEAKEAEKRRPQAEKDLRDARKFLNDDKQRHATAMEKAARQRRLTAATERQKLTAAAVERAKAEDENAQKRVDELKKMDAPKGKQAPAPAGGKKARGAKRGKRK
jgi:hypothetical protein